MLGMVIVVTDRFKRSVRYVALRPGVEDDGCYVVMALSMVGKVLMLVLHCL